MESVEILTILKQQFISAAMKEFSSGATEA